MFNNLLDLHTHTDNSPDAHHAGMVLCEYAVRKGLGGIAMTGHCGVGLYYSDHDDKITAQSYFEICKAMSVFRGNLVICRGIELGQPSVNFDLADEIVTKFKYGIVLASLHYIKDEKDFYFINYKELDGSEIYSLLQRYFEELLSIVKWNKFDVLAHSPYPLRYICGRDGIEIDMLKFSDIIDEILKLLAYNGKALEINTSGFRNGFEETCPAPNIIKRFHELGGEYVTVGSDAHNCYDVGANLIDGYKAAYDAGFRSSVLFQEHMPVTISFT